MKRSTPASAISPPSTAASAGREEGKVTTLKKEKRTKMKYGELEAMVH